MAKSIVRESLPRYHAASRKAPDAFIRGYISGALSDVEPIVGKINTDGHDIDIEPKTLARMIADCKKFLRMNAEDTDISRYIDGLSFWLARNRRGSIWSHEDTDGAVRLKKSAEKFGRFGLYAPKIVLRAFR